MTGLPQIRFAPNPLVVLAVALSLGVFAGHLLVPQPMWALATAILVGAILALLCAYLATKNRGATTVGVMIAAFFSAGVVLSLIDSRPIAPNRIARLYEEGVIAPGDPVELTGVVSGEPEPAPQSFYLTVKAERIRFKGVERDASGTVLLLAPVRERQVEKEYNALQLRHGAQVRVMTSLDREEDFRNPGVLPFTEYLERKGYDATGVIKSPLLIERLDDERVFLPLAWLYEWRKRLEKEFASKFSAETAGVLDAALLGNRYNVSHASADRFRAGGTFHVLVIAGLHISFVAGVVFLFVRWMTRRRFLQFICAVTFVWAYVIAVGAHEPVVRAALMFTLAVFAPIVSRRTKSLNAIGGAGLALLIWWPGDLFDPAFQLTFLSVLPIALIAAPLLRRMSEVGSWRPTGETPYPPAGPRWFRVFAEALFWSEREWRDEMAASNISYRLFKTPVAAKLERWHIQRFLRFAVAAVVVSGSLQVGIAPLMVIYFHRLSLASLFLNIFVGGSMAILAFVALAGVLVSHVSAWLAWPLIMLAERVNWLMTHLVDPFSRLGIASIRMPHYSGWMAGVYGLYYVPLAFLIFALARWHPLRPVSITRMASRTLSPRRLRFAAAAFLAILAVIVLHPFSAARPDGKLHVDFLDVGQGDSALVTMPDGTTLMIDGGGRPNINRGDPDDGGSDEPFQRDTRSIGEGVVSEFLWARGLDRIDYLMPTHADSDHIDGLNDVARNFKVRSAIVARTPPDDPEYVRFAATMKEAGVAIEKIGAGDILHFGNVAAEVLWPPPTANLNVPSGNNDGVVMRIRCGDKTLLFTADIEKQAEVAVLKEGVGLRSDIVKVPHHGSRTSSTSAFVAATHPSLAIISVGRTSIFGHPHKEVIERWRASGAEVMTTGQRGTISVVTDGKDLKVSTFVPR
jgi:competence protein ComEC